MTEWGHCRAQTDRFEVSNGWSRSPQPFEYAVTFNAVNFGSGQIQDIGDQLDRGIADKTKMLVQRVQNGKQRPLEVLQPFDDFTRRLGIPIVMETGTVFFKH